MIFRESPLIGAHVIELEPRVDERGFFARSFCRAELEALGLDSCVSQANISGNKRAATLRGMHYQRPPHAETKIVRCTRGSIFDVIVDLRPGSTTYLGWFGETLSDKNYRMMYIPKGFAHGYQTLEDDSEVFYMVSEPYSPGSEGGLRWDDPAMGIKWPLQDPIVSVRDREHPLIAAK